MPVNPRYVGLRNIFMEVQQSEADPNHRVSFTDPQVYSEQTAARQAAFVDTILYAASSGLDDGGAYSAELAGSYHSGGNGFDTYERLTATIKDKDGNLIYWYRKSDGKFWDRIHIPRNTVENKSIWETRDDYVPITEEQFRLKQAPPVPEGLGSVTTTTLTIKLSPKSTTPTLLKLAVCLFPGLTVLDLIGPMTVLKILESRNIETLKASYPMSPRVQIETTHFSHNRAPVVGDVGPELTPQRTYEEVLENFEQYDLILVPGGIHAAPDEVDPSLMEFIKKQEPGARHILTVCSGSWVLAGTGLLNGKKATTNAQLFKKIVAATDESIKWVPNRWVPDGKIWTSSEGTAGMDMANAFLEFLAGKEFATLVRARIKLGVRNQGNAGFAEMHGIV